MALTSSKQPEAIRLLLDQGFPKPPGFEPSDVDRNLQWMHLWDWNRELSERSTPDWALYCEAAFGGFNGVPGSLPGRSRPDAGRSRRRGEFPDDDPPERHQPPRA